MKVTAVLQQQVEFDIDHDVPLPPRAGLSRAYGKWTRIAEKMEHGDSIVIENLSLAGCLRHALMVRGLRIATRKIDNTHYRAWAIKPRHRG